MVETPTDTADSSARFVLAEDAPYLRNLAALWAACPPLAREIEALDVDDRYRVEPSKAGPPTLAIDVGPRTVHLHSRHQPIDEARRLVDTVDHREKLTFYVHGFGLGYHAEMLFDRAGSESQLWVFEPDLQVLRAAFEHRDLSRLIDSRRVHFVWRADKGELFTRLMPSATVVSLGAEPVSHPASRQLHPGFFAEIERWLEEFAAFGKTSLNTLVLNGKRTAENVSRNAAWYAAAPGLARLKNAYKGQPAVVVSAGPSLRKNRHLLKEVDGKAVVVAVQTTLQPLVEMGVEPQFVTSLDYHDISTRFFEKLPPTLRTELVAEPKAAHAILGMHPGPMSLLGNEFSENLLREMNLARPKLPAGATVAHLAYYLTEFLGCDPIIFVGQDLGFGDGLCYAPGTSYEDVWRPELSRFCTVEMKQWEQIVRDRPILRKIPDHQGRPMYTEERLFAYLQQFERDFAASKARIIDATEGGALKRGTTPMTLADAIAQFCTTPLPQSWVEHPGVSWDRFDECVECLVKRRDEALRIERISRQTLPLLEEIRDHLDDPGRVNRVIAQVDVLRAQMNELGATYDLVTQLTQSTELNRFKTDLKISAAKLTTAQKQKRQVGRDIENVNGVAAAASAFQGLMDEVIELVRREHAARARKGAGL